MSQKCPGPQFQVMCKVIMRVERQWHDGTVIVIPAAFKVLQPKNMRWYLRQRIQLTRCKASVRTLPWLEHEQ